jgi:peptidoglycan/LPS O-acetylase OafA/YrhL
MKSAAPAHLAYRPEIDGLRALAVLMVVIVHAFPAKLAGGFIGVDVFFVISGFLITSIVLGEVRRERFTFREFYIRRANRIFPALILVLSACLAFGWSALYADEFKSLGRAVAAGSGFVANLNLYQEVGYWDVASRLKPTLHLWSLGVEEQFYLLFPAVIWALWKRKFNLLTVLLLWALASGLWCMHTMRSDPAAAFYLPLQRSWELAAGALLAYLTLRAQGRRLAVLDKLNRALQRLIFSSRAPDQPWLLNHLAAALGLAMIAWAAFGLDPSIPFPSRWALLPVGGAVLLIAAGPAAWLNRVLFSNRVAVYLGLISYPLYLWHWPLLSFAQIVESGAPSNRERNLALLASLLLAMATYHLVEQPLRRSPRARGAKALVLAALLALAGGSGYYVASQNGLPARPLEASRSENPFQILRPPVAQDNSNPCYAALPALLRYNLEHDLIPGTQVHCQAPSINDVSIVMLGDSNAGHYARDLHARYAGQMLTIHSSGRPFLRGMHDDETSQAVMNFVVQQKQIKTVLISHLGVGYVQDEHPTLNAVPRWDLRYGLALKKTIQLYQEAGKRVILVQSMPVLDFDPKRCQQRPYAGGGAAGKCSIPRADILVSHRNYYAVMKHIQAEFPGLEVLSTMDYFCDSDECYAKRDGKILYADSRHVNYNGSLLVTRPLIEMIERGAPAQAATAAQAAPAAKAAGGAGT